ncbi:MAG: NAD-dependent dehydratase [Nitrospiraceae bacterium]
MLDDVAKNDIRAIIRELDPDTFNGKKVLVTGGAGFIGSWLCDVLVESGTYITCLDNLSSGSLKNVNSIIRHERFKFINADVNEWSSNEKFDIIIHCASIPSPEDYMTRPIEAVLPNSLALINMLEKARKDGSTLLFTSTSEVYGDATVIPTPEEYWGYVNPIGLRSCYDESKRFGEALCFAYHRQYGVDVRIARIFNTYGPKIDVNAGYARVIPRFIMQALRGEPITVHGDGRQTRSFTYITDTITALIKMLATSKAEGEVINIGNPHETSIIELANMIKKLTNSTSPILFTKPRPDDPRRRCPDITKAEKILGWEPRTSLEEGLKRTIKWMKLNIRRHR